LLYRKNAAREFCAARQGLGAGQDVVCGDFGANRAEKSSVYGGYEAQPQEKSQLSKSILFDSWPSFVQNCNRKLSEKQTIFHIFSIFWHIIYILFIFFRKFILKPFGIANCQKVYILTVEQKNKYSKK